MTYEEKAKWITRVFVLSVLAAIVAVVFGPSDNPFSARKNANADATRSTDRTKPKDYEIKHFDIAGSLKQGQISDLLAEASKKRGSQVLGIVHCHIPGNADSEELADILNIVAAKYGDQVMVFRVNIIACPEFAQAAQVTKPPEVLMLVDTTWAFRFQGLWPRPQIERKVDELIHGLRRVGKDWRPNVPGMQPASGTARARP